MKDCVCVSVCANMGSDTFTQKFQNKFMTQIYQLLSTTMQHVMYLDTIYLILV